MVAGRHLHPACEARRSLVIYSWMVTAAFRSFSHPGPWSDRYNTFGFRLVRDITFNQAEEPELAQHPRRQVQP